MKDNNLLETIQENKELLDNLSSLNFDLNSYKEYQNMFEEYLQNYHQCEKNSKLQLCQQVFKGYKYVVYQDGNKFFLTRIECNHLLTFNELNKVKNNYFYFDFSEELLKLRLNDISNDKNFVNMKYIVDEMVKFLKGQRKKGIYLYGQYGIGKTYLLIRLANTLANNHRKVAFISIINLINRVKESFNSFEDSSFVTDLLKVDVLFLDDIGGETVSSWVRDDLLFRILNDRISQRKPIFFSSNFSTDILAQIYTNVKNDVNDKRINEIKAMRIVDRIRGLAIEMELFGVSRRSDE